MIMKWYAAKLIYAIEHESKPVSEIEERVVLIEARERIEAFQKAQQVGRSKQEELLTDGGTRLFWHFLHITALEELGNLSTGMEVFACTHDVEPDDKRLAYYERQSELVAASCFN